MLFHTWVFFVFFLIVYPVYLFVRKNNQLMNVWLLIASYTFYGWWNPYYLLLLFGTSAVDYLMVLFMERSQRTRKLWLIISLVSNFGFLGYFKYSGFLTENLNSFITHLGLSFRLPDPAQYPNALLALVGVGEDKFFTQVILPIGISFHTFQSMSYTIDAYFGNIKTERSFVRFLTFVSFFPQLVAGPIERARNLLPQLQGRPQITQSDITDGLSLFLVGFFKKVAIADYLSKYVDKVYDDAGAIPGAGVDPGYRRLRLADLLRLQRLHRHGSRRSSAHGLSPDAELQQSLCRRRPRRLLGPLAHKPLHLVQGLRLFPPGRQPERPAPHLSQHVPDHGDLGHLARRRLDLRYLGSAARHRPAGHARTGADPVLQALGPEDRQAAPRFRVRHLHLDLLPCSVSERRLAHHQPDLFIRLCRPQFPVLMAILILAVWAYQLLYTSDSHLKRLLELAPVRLGLVLLMVVYLAIVAQPSTKAFIYFQF